MASTLADSFASLNSVAMGDAKADLVLKNCSLLSVYTKETVPDTQIAVAGDRIAYVGPDAGHATGPGTVTVDLEGRYVGPGLADPHLHMDQFVLQSEFVKEALLCGVTSLFSDPIDVVSVAGHRGFREFLRLGEDLPARVFQVVPGGLPVDAEFSSGRTLSPAQERSAVRGHPNVVGLGEVFSWTKVTSRDPRTMESLSAMLGRHDCAINGHTAGASGRKLNAYVASGILSCHEPINFDQVLERLRLGMWVMIREGSIRRDLAGIVSRILSHGTPSYLDRLMFCSDGLDPPDMRRFGHIDHCIREAVGQGMDPLDALSMASRNSFDYYSMGRDLGGIAPGKLADILVYDDLESFRPSKVFVGGSLVVSDGSLVAPVRKKRISPWIKKTVRLPRKITRDDFVVRADRGRGGERGDRGGGEEVAVNTIRLQTEIITGLGSAVLARNSDGSVGASPDADVWKVAAFDRIRGTGRRCVGFLENFGAGGTGALASTWSFHENDLVVIGADDSDMAAACNHVARSQGGIAVAKSGRILASLPLQFAGIVSTAPFDRVLSGLEEVNGAIRDAGCRFARPHLIPLFLPFLALPSVRILSRGIIDVKRREYIQPIRGG